MSALQLWTSRRRKGWPRIAGKDVARRASLVSRAWLPLWSRGGAGSCSLILPGTIDLMLEVVEQPDQVLDLPIPFLGRAPEEVDHFLDRPMQRIGVTDEDHVPARACQGGTLFPADPRGGEDQPGARSGDKLDTQKSRGDRAASRLGVNEVEHRKASLLVASRGAVPLSDERLAGCEGGERSCVRRVHRTLSVCISVAFSGRPSPRHLEPCRSWKRRVGSARALGLLSYGPGGFPGMREPLPAPPFMVGRGGQRRGTDRGSLGRDGPFLSGIAPAFLST